MAFRGLSLLLSLLIAASPAAASGRAYSASAPTATPIQAPLAPLAPLTAISAQLPVAVANVPAAPQVPNLAAQDLRRFSSPDVPAESVGRRIDGAHDPKASSPEVPVVAAAPAALPASGLGPSAPQPPKKQPGFFRRLNAATDTTSPAERVFERAIYGGLTAAIAVPVALKMEPAMTAVLEVPLALTGMVALFGLITLYRAAKFVVTRKDPVRTSDRLRFAGRSVAAAIGLGLVMGWGLVAAPRAFETQITEAAYAAVEPGSNVRAVPGETLPKAVLEELALHKEGRDTIDGLRDRFGVVRMPRFYVGNTRDAVARYAPLADALTVDAGAITAEGVSVEQFLASTELQAAFAKRHGSLFAHELRHAGQSRRSPLEDGVVRHIMNFEAEYESYLTEHFWAFDKLKADPGADLTTEEYGNVLAGLDDFDTYLRMTEGGYPKNVHIDEPYYNEKFARLRAGWPAHQVELNLLLAARYRLQGAEKTARMHESVAARIAAKHGLPVPAIR